MPKTDSKPRLTIEVTSEQYNVLKQYIEHGMQRRVFSIIINDVVEMLNMYGEYFIIALLEKKISYRNFMLDYVNNR